LVRIKHRVPPKHLNPLLAGVFQSSGRFSEAVQCAYFERCSTSSLPLGRCPLWVKSRHHALKVRCPLYPQKSICVRFSNRPIRVKRVQSIHDCGVDVARGLALLFGIGTRALPSVDFRKYARTLIILNCPDDGPRWLRLADLFPYFHSYSR
jgi:hypothetical protein